MPVSAFFETWNSFLNNFQLYYRDLNYEGKIRFVSRVQSIYKNVEIIGKEGLELTEEIKILVISNLVQLTFGLEKFWLYGYDYLYLYPDSFCLKTTQKPVAGSTFQSKIIALSWKDFAHDHLHAQDGKNISLLQYAKALVRTVLNGKNYDLKFGSYLEEWFLIIKKECEYKQNRGMALHIWDSNEDMAEVFARCVEIFFEKPVVLKKELPNTFAHLCCLLNQNPLNITENYSYNIKSLNSKQLAAPLPREISIHYKFKQWHWTYNLPLFGLSICPMVYYFIHERQLIHNYQVLSIVFMLGLVCGLVFYPYLKSIYLYKHLGTLLPVSILGFSPCLITAILSLNLLYAYPFTSEVSSHKIASYYQSESNNDRLNPQSITFNFSDDFLIDYPKLRTFKKLDKFPTHPLTIYNEIKYEIRRGMLGIPILYQIEPY